MSDNNNTKWSPLDDQTLLVLIERKPPVLLKEIAKLLGRKVGAVRYRLNETHREAWRKSGHPSCQPNKGLGAAKMENDKLQRRLEAIESKIADIGTRLSTLETDLLGER